jgi:hypothetical protein
MGFNKTLIRTLYNFVHIYFWFTRRRGQIIITSASYLVGRQAIFTEVNRGFHRALQENASIVP